jgi:hypothetical protein
MFRGKRDNVATGGLGVPSEMYFPQAYPSDLNTPLAEKILNHQQVNVGSNRIARSFRSMTKSGRTKAGDLFQNTTFTIDASHASVEDNLLMGKGHDKELGAFLNTRVGDNLSIGLGMTYGVYAIDAIDWNSESMSYDLIMSYRVAESFFIGMFLNHTQTTKERQVVGPAGYEETIPGVENCDRWGGGLLAGFDVAVAEKMNLGITGALTSMNKSSIGRLGDNENSAAVLLTDLNIAVTDGISLDLYVSYLTMLDRDDEVSTPDGSYYTMGVDLGIRTGKKSKLSIGYGTITANNDYEENRLNLSLTANF